MNPTPYYEADGITLYCGDAREIVPAIVADASIDLVLTDPPYGHNNNNNGDLINRIQAALGVKTAATDMEPRPIANDGPEEAAALVRWLFTESRRVLVPGCCCCCCCCGGGPDPQFARWSLWMDEAIGFKQMIVWDKGGLGMGWHYRRNYETILVGEKPGAACKWYGGNSTANVIRLPGIKPTINDHPTPKPVALMAFFIRCHTAPGDIVLDPFAGAGTTLVAARELGRRAIGIELDRRWCDLAVERLRQGILGLSGPPAEPMELAKR